MSLRLITPAASYPLTLAEARAQCRVDGTDDDTYLTSLIAAATSHVEDYTGRALVTQTWELVLDKFADAMMIPKGPVTAVSSVKYFDVDGVQQTITDTNYVLDAASDPQWLVRASDYTWPSLSDGINNVVIRFVCGYSTVPDAILHAIRLLVSQWYDARGTFTDTRLTELPNAVEALLANHRSFAF
jgi:uncharacterized phiE125 gp8 family phage protein